MATAGVLLPITFKLLASCIAVGATLFLSFSLFFTFTHDHAAVTTTNENHTLWKLGSLPPGLITFYSTTKSLDKSWQVLGLGYNPSISWNEICNAAVVHCNANMKLWLDIAMGQFKPLWTKYVDAENEHVQACNFSL